MDELFQILHNSPRKEHLGVWGYFGDELLNVKNDLEDTIFFHGKKIRILDNPSYPKKTKFFTLKDYHQYVLSNEVFLFAFYLTEQNNIFLNCSEDSFVEYEH